MALVALGATVTAADEASETGRDEKKAAKTEKAAKETKTKAGEAPAMTPEQQAMMDAWQKAATPGPAHALLEPFAGRFRATVTTWEPGKPPQTSTATAETRWIFGNRWLEQRYQGDMMGEEFEGIGYTGYDNVQGKYVGSWMDSMSTGMLTNVGTVDASGKVFTFIGRHFDPMSGKETTTRQVLRVDSKDRHVFEFHAPDPTGKEAKMMEIVYVRKGSAPMN